MQPAAPLYPPSQPRGVGTHWASDLLTPLRTDTCLLRAVSDSGKTDTVLVTFDKPLLHCMVLMKMPSTSQICTVLETIMRINYAASDLESIGGRCRIFRLLLSC